MRRVVAVLFFSLVAAASFAQQVPNNDAVRGDVGRAIADPGLQSTSAQPHSQLSLVSSNEGETQVRAEVGYLSSQPKVDWVFAVRVTAPINKGGTETKLASLTGLGNGSKAGLHLTRIGYGPHYNPDGATDICAQHDQEIVDDYGPLPRINVATSCTAEGIRKALGEWRAPRKMKEKAEEAFDEALLSAAASVCAAYNKSGEGTAIDCDRRAQIADELRKTDKAIDATREKPICGDPNALAPECWTAKLNEETKKTLGDYCERLNTDRSLVGFLLGSSGCDTDDLDRAGPEWAERAERAIALRPTFLSFAAEVQNQTFKFAPGATLDETKETHQNLSLSAAFGRLYNRSEWYFGISAAIERVFEGAIAGQVCGPIEGTTLTTCKTIARSGPTHDDNEIVSVEARHYITDAIAIQPRVSHDFADDINAAEVTLYLFANKDKGLNGGLRLGYREDDDQPSLIVFIGVPFNLFGE
jgi:hypothetical protein